MLIHIPFFRSTILGALIGEKYYSEGAIMYIDTVNRNCYKWIMKINLDWKGQFSLKKSIYLPPKQTFSYSNDNDFVFFFVHLPYTYTNYFGWSNQIFWSVQPNTMVNLMGVFAQENKNSLYYRCYKKEKKNIWTVSKSHCSRLGLNLGLSSFLSIYLYLTA